MEPLCDKDDIIQRALSILSYRNNLLGFAERIGINPDWVKAQHLLPFVFGPGEQANPFFSTYAYSRNSNITPSHLHMEIQKEKQIEKALRMNNVDARWALLTLKYDSFTSSGPTSRYHFLMNNGETLSLVGNNKAKKLSGAPFCDVIVDRSRVIQCLEQIVDSPEGYDADPTATTAFYNDVYESLAQAHMSGDNIRYIDFCNSFNQRTLARFSGKNRVKIE